MKYILILLSLLLFACTKEKLVEPDTLNDKIDFRQERTTISAFTGDFQIIYPGDPAGLCGADPQGRPIILIQDQLSAGESNVTGASAGSFTGCFDLYLLEDPSSSPGRFEGLYTLTGEDGDEIHFEMSIKSFPDPADDTYSILKGTYEITGGTGMFEFATGRGILRGSGASVPGPEIPVLFRLEGQIKY